MLELDCGTTPQSLKGLLDLVGLEAARTDVFAARRTVDDDPHFLQIGVKTTARCDHRVASAVAERRSFAAAETYLGPCAAECSGQLAGSESRPLIRVELRTDALQCQQCIGGIAASVADSATGALKCLLERVDGKNAK